MKKRKDKRKEKNKEVVVEIREGLERDVFSYTKEKSVVLFA